MPFNEKISLEFRKRNEFEMPNGIDKNAVNGTLVLAGMLKIGLSIQSVSEIKKTEASDNHFPKPALVHKAKNKDEIRKSYVNTDLSVEILEEDFERAPKPRKKVKKHQKRKIETPKTYLVLPRS